MNNKTDIESVSTIDKIIYRLSVHSNPDSIFGGNLLTYILYYFKFSDLNVIQDYGDTSGELTLLHSIDQPSSEFGFGIAIFLYGSSMKETSSRSVCPLRKRELSVTYH